MCDLVGKIRELRTPWRAPSSITAWRGRKGPIIDHGMAHPAAHPTAAVSPDPDLHAQTELRESGNDMPTRSDSGQPRAKCVRSKRGVEPHLSCRRSEFRVTILILNLIVGFEIPFLMFPLIPTAHSIRSRHESWADWDRESPVTRLTAYAVRGYSCVHVLRPRTARRCKPCVPAAGLGTMA